MLYNQRINQLHIPRLQISRCHMYQLIAWGLLITLRNIHIILCIPKTKIILFTLGYIRKQPLSV